MLDAISVVLGPIIVRLIGLFFPNEKFREYINAKFKGNKNTIEKYFESSVRNNYPIDFFFYQLGLRKKLPIMDWLYFEYIKFLNENTRIKKLIIFPTIDTSEALQAGDDFSIFCENVKKIFKNSGIELEFIDPFQDRYFYKKDLFSKDFIAALNYIGSEKFFKSLKKSFHIKITSISDFNKSRPKDDKIKNIFIHIHKSWSIVNYIRENIKLDESVHISAIFWKWQVDKLGVIKHYLSEKKVNFYPVLGITQNTEPLELDSICIFDSDRAIKEKAIKSQAFLKRYNLLLESVLSRKKDFNFNKEKIISDGEKQWRSFEFGTTNDTQKIKNTKCFFLFLGLIDEIKRIIENENA